MVEEHNVGEGGGGDKSKAWIFRRDKKQDEQEQHEGSGPVVVGEKAIEKSEKKSWLFNKKDKGVVESVDGSGAPQEVVAEKAKMRFFRKDPKVSVSAGPDEDEAAICGECHAKRPDVDSYHLKSFGETEARLLCKDCVSALTSKQRSAEPPQPLPPPPPPASSGDVPAAEEKHPSLQVQKSFQNFVLGTQNAVVANQALRTQKSPVSNSAAALQAQKSFQNVVMGTPKGENSNSPRDEEGPDSSGASKKGDENTKREGGGGPVSRGMRSGSRLAATRCATVYKKVKSTIKGSGATPDAKSHGVTGSAIGEDHRIFYLKPQVFRIQPLQLEFPDLVQQQEEWFYFKLGWQSGGKPAMVTTQPKGLPFVFSDVGAFTFDVPEQKGAPTGDDDKKPEGKRGGGFLSSKKKSASLVDERAECFVVELWKSNRLKDSLFGSVEIPLTGLLHTAGNALEQQHDLWYSLYRADQVVSAEVRVAIEFGRSDQSLEQDIRSHVVRLVAATPGDVEQSAIWPQSVRRPEQGLGDDGASGGGGGSAGAVPQLPKAPDFSRIASKGAISRPPLSPRARPPSHFYEARPVAAFYAKESTSENDDDGEDTQSCTTPLGGLLMGAEYGAGDADLPTTEDLSSDTLTPAPNFPTKDPLVAQHPDSPALGGGGGGGDASWGSPAKKTDAASLAFNEEWQQCVESLAYNPDVSIYETISNLSRNFCATARRYGSLIVSELHLPDEMKTIRPSNMGGIIGGAKYIVGGILYKVARPSIEGQIGEEEAQKIAGHELKALTALFNVNSVNNIGLALPMMACIDVLGFRLLALALCPLSSNTLIHGSADGGHTIMQDQEAEAKLRLAASCLNLKVHTVRGHEVPLAVDVECHAGRDGRLYLIDLSRTLPPQKPNRSFNQLCHLFQLLRPELVRSCPFPLCSDACSAFVNDEPDRLAHSFDVARATEHLILEVVPVAAIYLDGLHTARSEPDWSFFSLSHLKRCLHVTIALGVNRRFLGMVRKHCTNRISRQLLLIDIVSRTAKKVLRKVLRTTLLSAGRNQETQISQGIINFWNVLLSQNAELEERTRDMWERLAEKLQSYFGPLGPENSFVTGSTLWRDVRNVPQGTLLLFQRTTEQVGTTWSKRVHRLIDISITWFEKREKELEHRRGVAGKLFDVAGAGFRAVTGVVGAVGAMGAKLLPSGKSPRPERIDGVSSSSSSILRHQGSTTDAISPRGGGKRLPQHKRTGSSIDSLGEASASSSGLPTASATTTNSAAPSTPKVGHARQPSTDDPLGLRESNASGKGNVLPLSASSAATLREGADSAAPEELSPFEFWAVNSTQMLFEDDVADVAGTRLKLNNVAAMAQGIRLMRLAQSKKDDPELLGHFRSLTSRLFEQCLQNNPTNSQALREFALVLLDIEAQRLGKSDWMVKDSLQSVFWSSGVRYVDFLFRTALESNPFDSECLYYYALFQSAGGRSPLWLLLRAALCDHFNNKVLVLLSEHLDQKAIYQKESLLLSIWVSSRDRVAIAAASDAAAAAAASQPPVVVEAKE